MPDTILITGCLGFIGSHLTERVYDETDWRILGLDALTYAGDLRNVPERVWQDKERFEFWHGRVENPAIVEGLVTRSQLVAHLAAESHVTRSIYDDHDFLTTDVMGTQTVMAAGTKARTLRHILHMSTSEVYGTAEECPMTEKHPLNPRSPYAAAKAAADCIARSYRTTYGLPLTVLRAFNQFGPRQHPEKAIPRFLTSAIEGKTITLHGNGSAIRDFTYVLDTCRMIVALLKRGPLAPVYNWGTRSMQMAVVASECMRVIGGTVGVRTLPERPGQVAKHHADSRLLEGELGEQSRTAWPVALAETAKWYEKNREWWEPKLRMAEITLRLPDGRTMTH